MTKLEQFLQNARDVVAASPHVSIDAEKVKTVAATFRQASSPPPWNDYISDAAKADPFDATRVLFEMAMICAQQGGFITPDENGVPQKWNINGSGAAAMLNKMDELRAARVIPGVDFHDATQVDAKMSPHLQDAPMAKARLDMFREFAEAGVYEKLDKLVKAAWEPENNRYNFDFNFINDMADLFPQGFAADPFRKKAILSVLMTAAHAESRNVSITTDAPVASDYVLPQVLEGLGVLKLSDGLREKLQNREGFDEKSDIVRDIRAATIAACADLAAESGASHQSIDSHLWLAGRDPAVKPKLLPAMNVYTTWF